MKKHIPNLITLLNLAAGFVSIIFILKGEMLIAVWILLGAMIFDFSDGMAARLLNSYSELGKQLDSLADMVSFGVAPGLIMYLLIANAPETKFMHDWIAYAAILIPVMSGLRLGIFNIDSKQSDNFLGLPTPANAFFIFSLVLAGNYSDSKLIQSMVNSREVLLFFTLSFSILMVTRIPMISLKIKHMRFKGNELRLLFAAFSILTFILAGIASLPLIVLIYIVVSVTNSFTG
jgi:CDP-diacylglycerol---serine O-phosphatidyltransferase